MKKNIRNVIVAVTATILSFSFNELVAAQSEFVDSEFSQHETTSDDPLSLDVEVANEFGETTFSNGYLSSAVENSDHYDENMTGIDAIYNSLPPSAINEKISVIEPNELIERTEFEKTFTILGGFDLDTIDGDLEPSSLDTLVESYDESGYAISVATGRRYRRWFRAEIEFAVRDSEINAVFRDGPQSVTFDSEILAVSLLGNAIFEWNNASRFTPYGGAGLGTSYLEIDENLTVPGGYAFLEGNDFIFSWQAIAGVATEIRQGIDFVTEYKYFSTADIETEDGTNVGSLYAHNLFFGLLFNF